MSHNVMLRAVDRQSLLTKSKLSVELLKKYTANTYMSQKSKQKA